MKYRYLLMPLLLAITACESSIDIADFDEAAFKADAYGCSGTRFSQKNQLIAISSQLKGYTQTQIRAALGKPDRQELSERNQKYFVYFLEPSAQCDSAQQKANPLTMYIRFSAVNRSTEVSFQNY